MTYGKLSLTDVIVKQVPVYDRRPSLQGNLVTAAAAVPPWADRDSDGAESSWIRPYRCT